MPKIIATFENADTAEWALLGLRRSGADIIAYRLKPAAMPQSGRSKNNAPNSGGLFPYAFTNSVGPRDLSMGNYAPGPFDDAEARKNYDIRSAEVTLTVAVPTQDITMTQAYLTARHGRVQNRE